MTAALPGQRFAPCRCSHSKEQHEALAPQCAAPACTCLSYRPNLDPAASTVLTTAPAGLRTVPARPPLQAVPANHQPTPPTNVSSVVAAGKRSDSKRIQALAAKVENLYDELLERLRAEREAVEERRRAEQAKADAKRLADQARETARREVAELEAKLKAAKQRLRSTPAKGFKDGGTPPVPKKPAAERTGTAVCPDCGKDGLSNLGAHRSRAHGYRAEA